MPRLAMHLETLRREWPRLKAALLRERRVRRREPAVAGPDTPDAETTDRPTTERRNLNAEIACSDAFWRIVLRNAATGAVVDRRDCSLLGALADEAGAASVLDSLRDAVDALGMAERTDIAKLVVLPLDPDFDLFDARAVRALATDPDSLTKLAGRLLGEAEAGIDAATWASAAGAPEGMAPGAQTLVGAARLERVRRYIGALGDLAPYLAALTPYAAAVLQPDDVSATLYVGLDGTELVCGDPGAGVVVRRAAPVGLRALVRSIAAANSLPFAEALREANRRPMLRQAVDVGAAPEFERIADLARETFAYVADSRLGQTPRRLRLLGPLDAVAGFGDMLAAALGVEIVAEAGMPLPTRRPDLNLLRSLKGEVFSQGARAYKFEGDRFVAHSKDDSAKSRKGTGSNRPAGPRMLGPLALPDLDAEIGRGRLAVAGLVVLAAVALLGREAVVAPASASVRQAAARYQAAHDRLQAIGLEADKLRQTMRQDLRAAAGMDKILWTEKFAAIAAAMPPGLWLTDAAVVSDERKVGVVEVVTTKLVLKGRTMAARDARLQEIAAFIAALEDDDDFMRDFRRIVFAGLGADEASAGPSAPFEIHAWYDENKRRRVADDSDDPLTQARRAASTQADRARLFGGGQ